ncbi:MAG: tetratricopeptide repeat protein [Acidobacteriaceae bacterium]|nr:tetratricopeptide repeat protein [Acidobacteriaceae bacterium]
MPIKSIVVVVALALLGLRATANQVSTPPTVASQLAEANSLLAKGMLAEAEGAARKYLAEHADSADGHYLLGYILFRRARASASLAEYTEGAKYRKPSAADLQVVGADYVVLGDFPDADKWFTKSVEWNPASVLGWYYLGRTKYNENRFEEAVVAFQRCLKLDDKHVKAEDNLGLSYQALGRLDDALQAYRNAIDWQSDAKVKNPGPFIDIGGLFLETNQPEKAVEYLQKALEIAPDDPKAHQQLGKAYFNLNNLPKALDELEKAAQLAPNNAPVHYILAQVYRKQGLGEKAKGEFDRYTKLSATHSVADGTDYSKNPQ